MTDDSSTLHLTPLRARSRGILLIILMSLVCFAFGWYFLSPANTPAVVDVENSGPEFTPEQNPLYILLIGSDSRKGTALYTGREWEEGQIECKADILTLVRIDRAEHVLTFLSIPRDTLSVGSSKKINTWLVEKNPDQLVAEVERLTGVKIPYYMQVSFTGFENIVDSIGGISVGVPNDVSMLDPSTGKEVNVSAGPNQMLDGSKALAVASAWENTNELEPLRQMCVRAIEKAMVDKVASGDEDAVQQSLSMLRSNVSTNMDNVLLTSLALNYARHKEDYTVYMGSGPFQGSLTQDKVWAVARDEETWKDCMAVVDAGGDPNTVVVSLSSGA